MCDDSGDQGSGWMAKTGRRIPLSRIILFLLFCLVVSVTLLLGRSWSSTKPSTPEPVPEGQCKGSLNVLAARREYHVIKFNRKLNKEVRQTETDGEGVDIAFYGDSILETFRGTDMGRDCERCSGSTEVFQMYFGLRYNCKILAVGADQTSHLQWRLLNGQLMALNPPKLIVMMIGTNDLGADIDCILSNASYSAVAVSNIYSRIQDIVLFFQKHTPTSRVLLLGLPPRGVWDDQTGSFEHPSAFTEPTNALNQALRQLAAGREMISYLDCGDRLLTAENKMDRELQGDGLHLTAKGMAILAACILGTVEGTIGPGSRGPPVEPHHPFSQWLGVNRATGFWGD